MSTAEELFSTGEPHIVIGSDRKITVPDALKRIAVQYDHNVETVTFDCPRYWDDIDMSVMKVYINYMRADGKPDSYSAKNVTIDKDDETIMHFDWTITRNVTEVKGSVSFLVCTKNVDSNGDEINHWNSELNRDLTVSEGLECEPTILEQYPDVITQILIRLDSIGSVGEQVDNWLEEHPEATTTVQDASLTSSKMSDEMKKWIRTNIINVNDVGIVADDGTDCTEKINGIFEGLKGGEIVYFPSGTYIVSQEHGIKLNTSGLAKYTAIGVFNKNDIKIVLAPGAKIKCSLVTGTTQVGIFYFDNCNNVEITGGSIIGELSEHGSVVVNSGINGIEMKGCTNVYIHDVDINNCLGDGVRISPINGKRCENITLYNCVIHDCDRNGVSYDGVKNGVIRNCHIYNVTGHSPLAGIDLESEWKTDSNDLVNQDTIIDGCNIHDCGYAVTHSKHSYNTIISNCNFETLTITQSETSIGDLKVINSKFRRIFYFYKCFVENCDIASINSYSAEIGSAKGYFKNCNIQGNNDDTSDGAFLNICSYGDEIRFEGCTFRKENPNFTSTNRNIKKGFYSYSSKSGADTQYPFKIKLSNCVEYRWNYTKGFEGIVYNDTLELINCKFIFMNDVKIRPLVADKISNFKMINCIIDYENAIGSIRDYTQTSGFIRISQNDEDSTHTIIGNTIFNTADTEKEYIEKFITLTDDSKGNVILCNNIGINLKKIYEGSVAETGSLKTYGNVDSTTATE